MSSKGSFEEMLRDIRSTPKVFTRTCDNDMCNKPYTSEMVPEWVVVCGEMRMFCCSSCKSEGTWSIRYDERKLKRLLAKY